jgi:hypothetical protein
MRKYKQYREPYNEEYELSYDTPESWWLSVEDQYDYLQDLALKIFSITPHSASCERIFSTLGWLYGKRRQRLSLSKIEAMAKIRSFNISNIKKELAFASQTFTEAELRDMVMESTFLMDDDDDDDEHNDDDFENTSIDTSNNNIYVAIEDLFDLDQVPLYPGNDNEFEDEDELSEINESDENNSDSNRSKEEKDDDSSNYNYNIEELTAEMMWDNPNFSTDEEDQ